MKRRTIRKVITDPLEHNKKQINFPRVTVRQNNVNKVLSGAHRKPRSFTRAKHTEDAKPIKFATEITQANKEVCFIVGGGPSLTGFDFNQISMEET